MTVQHEIKSQLAKLLATEDLIVEHKQVQTAEFNVGTRVLTLPLWDKASNTVYDMLVGHEVGHALFTPDRDWMKEVVMPPSFVNIVEDVRIEKLMKRKYAGLAKSFYHGYEELNDDDFFGVANEDIDSLILADRINLHFKIGNFVDVSFSDSEKEIVTLIDSCQTFDDVLNASKVLYDYCTKANQETKEQVSPESEDAEEDDLELPQDGRPDIGEDNTEYDDTNDEESEVNEPVTEGETQQSDTEQLPQPQPGKRDNLDLKTVEALEDSLKDLTNKNQYHDTAYFEIPKLRLDRVIVPNAEIHEQCEVAWSSTGDQEYRERMEKYGITTQLPTNRFEYADQEYVKFKRNAQKEVNYLVKEFECRKAASSYARATTSRTGVLDTAKLHTYRYNEDLFKKVTTFADGKNHGLVFILDWSGSMGPVLLDTIKQLYNLLWFCKKTNIPFEVYAFTGSYPLQTYRSDGEESSVRMPAYESKEGVAHLDDHFSLMNFFTSKVRGKVLEDQMRNIFRIALLHEDRYRCYYDVPIGLQLSGTPLNETMLALHQVLPKFREENKVEKVQCVILTDGEGSPLRYHKNVKRRWEDGPFLGTGCIETGTFLRCRKTGRTYAFNGNWYGQTDVFLRNLRDKFTDVNFIGIRILAQRDGGQFIRKYTGGSFGPEYDSMMKVWKKSKSCSIKNSGYHTYFGLSSSALDNDTEFEVNEDATKAQIRTAFKKSLTSKKMNKKILGEFIELVA